MEMKFSDKFKKNKGEAAVNEAAQEGSEKKKHKPDPKKLVGTIFDMFFADGAYQLFRIRFMFLFAGVLCCLRYGCLAFIFLKFLTEFHFPSPPSSSVSSEWTAW